ncbi:MAG: hypothetical protein IJ809_02300 [Clostridia bacterium]|nr:hypothetical protein [Clostridia bacterium]
MLYDKGATLDLFAITNLNQAATAQANAIYSVTACIFSSSRYWKVRDLNDVTGYQSTDVMGKVNTYVQKKGAISRKITYI